MQSASHPRDSANPRQARFLLSPLCAGRNLFLGFGGEERTAQSIPEGTYAGVEETRREERPFLPKVPGSEC